MAKTTLGVSGVHKYKIGEVVRYRSARVPSRFPDAYDEETGTVEGESSLVVGGGGGGDFDVAAF